ncbi:phytanoyl-CoA dioxygenase family protein [Acidicapsa ligni]|uniref:phytanoyl-CoA dioxygenase family protein n=1 Tax=Acidicapsa ligni TaxID=542300 RepID=UPI0021DFB59D|nr:phytanoyl-CoA dioxygenase family protein [Acidicapsa ligni]
MKPFREIRACDLTSSALKEEIDARGYLLIRGLLPHDALGSVLSETTQILSNAGWLLPEHDPLERIANMSAACGDPDPSFKRTYQEIFNLESFHSIAHHPALKQAMSMLVGEQLLVHPKPIGRLIFPNCERLVVHAHQDYRFMDGDVECFTAWIPFHDCPINQGPLKILEGSHRFGFQAHDQAYIPAIPDGAAQGEEWAGGEINAGDVLIFHSLTVHAASPNLSNQLRLSLDCRFQNYERVLNPANLAFGGESGKSWETTYSQWHSDDLKYYWKQMPLALKPSKAEIEELAKTAESPSKRARYARIFSQI